MDLNGAFDPLSSSPPMGQRDADEDVFEPLPPPEGSEPPVGHKKLGRYTHR
jgi:hypothetical protein